MLLVRWGLLVGISVALLCSQALQASGTSSSSADSYRQMWEETFHATLTDCRRFIGAPVGSNRATKQLERTQAMLQIVRQRDGVVVGKWSVTQSGFVMVQLTPRAGIDAFKWFHFPTTGLYSYAYLRASGFDNVVSDPFPVTRPNLPDWLRLRPCPGELGTHRRH
jgi:hypothetical protein